MSALRYLSVCSGIEAASVAFEPLGWTPVAFSEIEPFPCSVLAHRFGSNLPGKPLATNGVPNLGDMTRFQEWPDLAVDLLVGGTPCQSFSVAGLRAGLADPRGNLALVYLALLDRYLPRWFLWENVPGVLSSGEGRDFGAFLGAVGRLGYGFAWRVLDAQYVRVDGFARAVPQRRRRVFVVGHIGADWRRAGAVLFDAASLRRDPAPRRGAWEGAASIASGGPDDGRVAGAAGAVSAKWAKGTGGPAGDETYNLVAHTLRGDGFDASEDGAGRGTPIVPVRAIGLSTQQEPKWCVEVAPTLALPSKSGGGQVTAVAFDLRGREDGAQFEGPHETANIRSASGGSSRSYVADRWAVRRLTPRECERLQGFPDDWTLARHRGKPAADGPRYQAIGNSMAVNVMRWIGRRIAMVEALGVDAQEAAE
jgi:DNA (cytosine-5)-methyltransferase 1